MPRLALDLTDQEARALRGTLLAARATELAEVNRRGFRHSAGYGSDAARDSMTAEVAQLEARIELLDRLIEALATPAD
jgi:hypothetical protein